MALRLGHCTSDFIRSKHYWRRARFLSFPVLCGDQDAVQWLSPPAMRRPADLCRKPHLPWYSFSYLYVWLVSGNVLFYPPVLAGVCPAARIRPIHLDFGLNAS